MTIHANSAFISDVEFYYEMSGAMPTDYSIFSSREVAETRHPVIAEGGERALPVLVVEDRPEVRAALAELGVVFDG